MNVMGGTAGRPRPHRSSVGIWVALIELNRDGLLPPEHPKLESILIGGNHDSGYWSYREDER